MATTEQAHKGLTDETRRLHAPGTNQMDARPLVVLDQAPSTASKKNVRNRRSTPDQSNSVPKRFDVPNPAPAITADRQKERAAIDIASGVFGYFSLASAPKYRPCQCVLPHWQFPPCPRSTETQAVAGATICYERYPPRSCASSLAITEKTRPRLAFALLLHALAVLKHLLPYMDARAALPVNAA
ncbi:hypothetical protein SAMN05192539_1004199 [Paraburkholderia diazotrophica]|uniref:Uncharacterized protein n=1 Tax=Paraburkholderia diazotrophica TaxID=667676 RepID=A0A1H6TQX6_9BURK|nr:hypothetical protein SAMN05192539_1004199 [Paraburkholderia diazotrophica]